MMTFEHAVTALPGGRFEGGVLQLRLRALAAQLLVEPDPSGRPIATILYCREAARPDAERLVNWIETQDHWPFIGSITIGISVPAGPIG